MGFDLDGTLVDSLEDIRAALNLTLVELGRAPLGSDAVRGYVGDGAAKLVARALSAPSGHPDVVTAEARFTSHYLAAPAVHTTLLPGALSVLTTLSASGAPLALCTNKPRRPTLALLEALELTALFKVVVCGDDLPERKPSPLPLLQLCQALEISPRSLVFVGDGPQDVLAARRAGSVSVAVTGGFAEPNALAQSKPSHTLPDLLGLPALLERL